MLCPAESPLCYMELHFPHLLELLLLAHERKFHSKHPQMRAGLSLPSLWKQKVYLDTEKSSRLAVATTDTLKLLAWNDERSGKTAGYKGTSRYIRDV